MKPTTAQRIRSAWLGRVSGCMLGKPVEILSMTKGASELTAYLQRAGALPLRDYVPLVADTVVASVSPETCRSQIDRAVADDDINYTVLALNIIEAHGFDFSTADVARAWLRLLPGGMTFTAERAAYTELLDKAGVAFTFGAPPDFDLAACSDNAYNDYIGAQIRADLYGWVTPGEPALAAELAGRDARLSHRREGVFGAQVIAATAAAIPMSSSFRAAIETAAALLPGNSDCAAAITLALRCAADNTGPAVILDHYDGLSPVHTVNNLALVVWGLLHGEDDYSVAVGETVSAGLDTDCNGATVGGLWGLSGRSIPSSWTDPWAGRIETSLAGTGELHVDDLIARTLEVVACHTR